MAVFNASEVQSEAIVLGPENTIIPLGSQVSYQITDEHAQLSDLKNDQTGWQKMALPDFLTPEQSLWVRMNYEKNF